MPEDPDEAARRRLREEEGNGNGKEDYLAALVGRTVLDLNTRFIGIVKTRIDRRMGRVYWLSDTGGRAQNLNIGATLVDPNTRQVINVDPTGGVESGGKLSEEDIRRLFGGGGAGAGSTYHPPAWKPGELDLQQQGLQLERDSLKASIAQSESELAWAKEEFKRAQAADDRRAAEYAQLQIDLLEKRLDNDNRQLVYSMGMQERGTLIQQKAETGRELMRLGPDPFRQWAHLGGGLQRGTTPQQAVVGQAQAFMQQPLPQVSMNMEVGQLEKALSQMQGQGMQQPQFGPGFGLAQGGVMEMEKGGGGAFSMKPKMSYLVGEGKHGEGLKAGTAEILTIGDGKVQVTPFGGGAATGMEFGLDRLASLYTGFGDMFGRVPRAKYGPTGLLSQHDTGASSFLRPEAFSAMGITPQLIQFGDSPTVYHRNPLTQQYQGIASADAFKKSGFNRSDVIQFNPSAKGAFDLHTGFKEPLPAGEIGMEHGAFGARARPLVEASTGAMLPAIHKIAGQLAQWKAAGDYRYDMALSAYGNALDPATGLPIGGISPQYIDAIVTAATPRAGAFGGRRIGFTGGYM